MKKHYETHVEDTDKLISVAGPILEYKSWYEQYRKLMEEQAQRKYGLYTPTSEGDDDDFPSIPGMIARYSASGLTNEQMKENPVWVDKTGNGHDLQMKNFLWGGMSGVGGYKLNWGDSSIWINYITQGARGTGEVTDNTIHITSAKSNNALFETRASLKSVEYKVLIKGLTDDIYLRYGVSNDGKELWTEIKNDGIYTLPSYDYDSKYNMRWVVMSQTYPIDCNITIEQLPLYPGALVFDGVDDYGVCENFPILTKEKGYTVVALRRWLSFQDIGYPSLVVNSTDRTSAFNFEDFKSKTKSTWNWGRNVEISDNEMPLLYTYQTSTSYNGRTIPTGATEEGSNILQVCRSGVYCANAAIWEIVILDHDATEEELTKIKDYFVKTYPWLFPDQAWTVVGKTNEDEDRATIANITGNGNNLVLSNFGFAEGSGYNEEGEYAGYLVTDGVDDKIVSSAFKMGKDFTVVGEWEFIKETVNKNSGIWKPNSFALNNFTFSNQIMAYIKSIISTSVYSKGVKALASDGKLYKDFNSEQELVVGNEEDRGTGLYIGYFVNTFNKIAFKNLAIYPRILSKDDCIKAYNYLQTLKSK